MAGAVRRRNTQSELETQSSHDIVEESQVPQEIQPVFDDEEKGITEVTIERSPLRMEPQHVQYHPLGNFIHNLL